MPGILRQGPRARETLAAGSKEHPKLWKTPRAWGSRRFCAVSVLCSPQASEGASHDQGQASQTAVWPPTGHELTITGLRVGPANFTDDKLSPSRGSREAGGSSSILQGQRLRGLCPSDAREPAEHSRTQVSAGAGSWERGSRSPGHCEHGFSASRLHPSCHSTALHTDRKPPWLITHTA